MEIHLGLVLPRKQQVWLQGAGKNFCCFLLNRKNKAFQWQAKALGRARGMKIRVSLIEDFTHLDMYSLGNLRSLFQFPFFFSVPLLVIAKMSELLALGETEKLAALRALNPEKILDSFDVVELFNDRFAFGRALSSLEVSCGGVTVRCPPSFEWTKESTSLPSFPLPWICKPRTADGTPATHDLMLMYERSEAGKALQGEWQLQPFVVHGGETSSFCYILTFASFMLCGLLTRTCFGVLFN
jgi:hypothetical protein